MEFKKGQFDNNVIINSDGDILVIVENVNDDNINEERPFLCILCNNGETKIYAPTNKEVLTLYFQGRLMTKELFLIKMDQLYYIENNGVITEMEYSEEFNNSFIETIDVGNMIFYTIPRDMRIEDPFETIMRYWDLFY